MKQLPANRLEEYAALVERYHGALDLMSDAALGSLDAMASVGARYGELLSRLSPTPESILDLGSGVGLPGIPVALSLPAATVTLVERRRRRATFLRIVSSQMGLQNVTVVNGDVRYLRDPCVEAITAQAVGRFALVYRLTRHLHGERIWLLSRRSSSWRDELAELELEAGSAILDAVEEELPGHGRLVAVLTPGGAACPPSGLSTKKGV